MWLGGDKRGTNGTHRGTCMGTPEALS